MTMMPQPMGMTPMMPPMPSPDDIEQAQMILDAVPWDDIKPILRTDERRNYAVDIETDSTVFEDAEAEKAARIECVTAVTTMLEKGVPAIQMNPKLAPLMKELGMFVLGAFKIGRTLEETFEETFDQLKNVEPQPDPEAQKLQAEMAMEEKRFQMDMELKKADLAAKQQATEMDMQAKQVDMQLKKLSAELDIMLKKMEMGLEHERLGMEREKMAMEGQAAQQEHAMRREELALNQDAQRQDHAIKREGMQLEGQQMREKAAIDRQSLQDKNEADREASKLKRSDMKFQSDMKRKQAAQGKPNDRSSKN